MIELKKLLANNVEVDEPYIEIFLVFQFSALFIDLPLFASGQYYYRFFEIDNSEDYSGFFLDLLIFSSSK